MKISIFLFATVLAFVHCEDAPIINLGPVHLDLKKSVELEDSHPGLAYEPTSEIQQRNLAGETIKAILESFRDDIDDPMVFDHLGPFVYTALGTRITANMYDLQATGQSWYVVDRASFNPIRLTLGVHLTVPWVTVTGVYDARARILLVGHNAGGTFRAFLNRVEVGVDLRLGTNILGGGHLVLRELDIKLDIHDTNIQINGLVGSSVLNGIINTFIQSLSQSVIQKELGNISQLLSDELFDVINEVLKGYKLADILG